MNAIFLKEVSDTVLNGKLIELNYINVSDEDYIIEINVSNKIIKSINKDAIKLKSTVIKNPERLSWINSVSRKFKVNRFKKAFGKIINKNDLVGYSVIYSNELKKNKKIKDYIEMFLNEFSINEYINISTVKENMDKYIEEYLVKNDLKADNINLLIIANDLESLSLELIEDLNEKYKEVNIFACNNIRKSFLNKVKNINDEYGSCISVLKKTEKDFRKYNVCIFVDKARTEYTKYRFNKKTCFIDFTNKENDKFNKKYIKLEKGIKDNTYYGSKIKELYELYGKITVANAIID